MTRCIIILQYSSSSIPRSCIHSTHGSFSWIVHPLPLSPFPRICQRRCYQRRAGRRQCCYRGEALSSRHLYIPKLWCSLGFVHPVSLPVYPAEPVQSPILLPNCRHTRTSILCLGRRSRLSADWLLYAWVNIVSFLASTLHGTIRGTDQSCPAYFLAWG